VNLIVFEIFFYLVDNAPDMANISSTQLAHYVISDIIILQYNIYISKMQYN